MNAMGSGAGRRMTSLRHLGYKGAPEKRGHPMLAAIAVTTRVGLSALLIAAAIAAVPARAQDYPTRPIALIVPFPAGGGVDAMGRIVAERLTAALGQQVIVDNRGGAAGVIGTRAAAKAAQAIRSP
jgi:hypothetical protein